MAKILGDAIDVVDGYSEKAKLFMLEYLRSEKAFEFSLDTNPPFVANEYQQLNYKTSKVPFDHLVRYEECDEQIYLTSDFGHQFIGIDLL